MSTITAGANATCGQVKPMHAVNNGPVYKFTVDQRITNIDAFREAGIPYARTHDAAFYSNYGGEHCVDILAVFPNFDNDPEDPASYDFTLTDEYLKVMLYAGVEPFYRLGSKIEHWPKKYGTLVPKDFHKWAVIAEHIIAHYTEGFADGFRHKIEYWEIWNEPDLGEGCDPVDKKTWSGTRDQFYEFFDVVAKHLKARFPHLKIGGPAASYPITDWTDKFLAYLKEHGTPIDFFSWHIYSNTPDQILKIERETRALMDSYGYEKAESILNEWNYVKGWTGDEWVYSLRMEKRLKGSSFIASVVAGSQYEPLDMLMYYDARPCSMNGLFSTDIVSDRLKGYWAINFFGELYRLGTAVQVASDDTTLYAAAAKSEDAFSLMVTYFEDKDAATPKRVALHLTDLPIDGNAEVTFRKIDRDHDGDIVQKQIIGAKDVTLYADFDLFTTLLISVRKI